MTDRAATEEADAYPDALSLEERVRRLEDVVATPQDTSQLEERVAARLSERAGRAPSTAIQESAGALLGAGKQLLPVAVGALQAGARAAEERARGGGASPRRPWLLFDAYVEARAMVRMYFDPRYRLSWYARLTPLALIGAMVTSWLWLMLVPGFALLPTFVATLLVKAVDLVLAFAAYKVLSREAHRYLETAIGPPG